VGYTDDLLNLWTSCKLKLPHLIDRGSDQATAAERQKKRKKTLPISQQPGKITTELLLKYPHQDWILKE
jgi:hypothetical protein